MRLAPARRVVRRETRPAGKVWLPSIQPASQSSAQASSGSSPRYFPCQFILDETDRTVTSCSRSAPPESSPPPASTSRRTGASRRAHKVPSYTTYSPRCGPSSPTAAAATTAVSQHGAEVHEHAVRLPALRADSAGRITRLYTAPSMRGSDQKGLGGARGGVKDVHGGRQRQSYWRPQRDAGWGLS